MTTYDSNHFEGGDITLDGAAWRRNLMKRCRIRVANPPLEFTGNRVVECDMHFTGVVGATLAFIRGLCANNPEMRASFRDILGLNDEERGDAKTH